MSKYPPFSVRYTPCDKCNDGSCDKCCKSSSSSSSSCDGHDYVIVGAGASGCVLASRLAEDGSTVLLLEEGGDIDETDKNATNVHALKEYPSLFLFLYLKYSPSDLQNPSKGGYFNTNLGLSIRGEPDDYDGNTNTSTTANQYPRGNAGGGSTRIHAMVSGRGSGSPYDKLATVLNTPLKLNKILNNQQKLWSYDDVLPYFKKMETYFDNPNQPKDPYTIGSENYHTHRDEYPVPEVDGVIDGWLPIQRQLIDPRPLTCSDSGPIIPLDTIKDDMVRLFFEKFKTVHSTLFDGSFNSEEPIVDISNPYTQLGFHQGERQARPPTETFNTTIRANSYEDLLKRYLDTKTNITVIFDCLVDKIIINNKVATGIQCYKKKHLFEFDSNGDIIQDVSDTKGYDKPSTFDFRFPNRSLPGITNYMAKKEVILCAGAWLTPSILMRSGIGDKSYLDSVKIPCVVDSPHVGKNVLDHLEMTLCFNVDPTKFINKTISHYLKHINTPYYAILSELANAEPVVAICDLPLGNDGVGSLPGVPDVPPGTKAFLEATRSSASFENIVYTYNLNHIDGSPPRLGYISGTYTDPLKIGNVSLSTGDIILLINQTDPFNNGAWYVLRQSATVWELHRPGPGNTIADYDSELASYHRPGKIWYNSCDPLSASPPGNLNSQYHYRLGSGTPFKTAMLFDNGHNGPTVPNTPIDYLFGLYKGLMNPGNFFHASFKNFEYTINTDYIAIKRVIDTQTQKVTDSPPGDNRNVLDIFSSNGLNFYWDDVFRWDNTTSGEPDGFNTNQADTNRGRKAHPKTWPARPDWAVNPTHPTFDSPSCHVHYFNDYFHGFNAAWFKDFIPNYNKDTAHPNTYDLDTEKFSTLGPNGDPNIYPLGTLSVKTMEDELTAYNAALAVGNFGVLESNKLIRAFRSFYPDYPTIEYSKIAEPDKKTFVQGFDLYNFVPLSHFGMLIENVPMMGSELGKAPSGHIKLNKDFPKDPRKQPFCVENIVENNDILDNMFNCVQAQRQAVLDGGHLYKNADEISVIGTDSSLVNGGINKVDYITASNLDTIKYENSTDCKDISYYLKGAWVNGKAENIPEVHPGIGINNKYAFRDYMKKWSNYGHHVSGTTRWGKNISDGVIDYTNRVFGVKNLRIGDTSCSREEGYHMYNTSMSAYVIAERLADIIKQNL